MIKVKDDKKSDKEKAEDSEKDETSDLASMINMALEKPELRATAIYGDINEERCAEAIYTMLALDLTGVHLEASEEGEKLVATPMEFYISSYGGKPQKCLQYMTR